MAYSNRNQLPVGLVAFVGSEPCGVVALKSESITTHRHLSPWVSGGMVAPQYRRHGIGTCMASTLEKVARNLDFKAINIDPRRHPAQRRFGPLHFSARLQTMVSGKVVCQVAHHQLDAFHLAQIRVS